MASIPGHTEIVKLLPKQDGVFVNVTDKNEVSREINFYNTINVVIYEILSK